MKQNFGKLRRCKMAYKVSKYNFITNNENGDYVICNLIKGPKSLRIIPTKYRELVDILSKSGTVITDSSNPELEQYRNMGYLTDENTDELETIDLMYDEVINEHNLQLTIMSTGQCNFRCKYCYEDYKKGAMSEDVQKKVLKYIQKQLSSFTKISIEWFGGEPLVGINVIENIMTQVDKMCTARKTRYSSSMTTNAYLLTPDVFEKLYNLKIYSYQITLDGTKEQHDTQRVLVNGQGTFDRILNNLLFIRDHKKFSQTRIAIRVNVTKSIAEHLPDFLQLYKQEFGDDKRFTLLLKEAGNLGGNNITGFEDNLLTNENTGIHDLIKTHDLFDRADYDLNGAIRVLIPMSTICYASQKNSYVIDSEGVVFKCTVHFDEKCNQVGYIDDNGNMVLDPHAHSLWYKRKKELSTTCRECKILPLCYGGGCTYFANFTDSNGCCSRDLKRHVEDYMKYLAKTMAIETID